ncbi:MAG: VWA domain-containing protein [Verrucomicrobiota bacterium]
MNLPFAHPQLLWLLLLLPALLWGQLRRRPPHRALDRVVAPRLRHRLLRLSPGRRWLAPSLVAVGLASILIALARPQFGESRETVYQAGRNVLLAIDCSNSMLVEDLSPNRLVRAKLAANDLLDALPGDRVGLITFAGTAFLEAPFTIDHRAVRSTIDQIETDNIPQGGTHFGALLDLALESAEKTSRSQDILIILSDGEAHEGEITDYSERLRQEELVIITVGVGTREGGIVPDPAQSGQFLRDQGGHPVLSRLETESLVQLASLSPNGLYQPLLGDTPLEQTIMEAISLVEEERFGTREVVRKEESFQPFVLAGLLLLASSLLVPVRLRPSLSLLLLLGISLPLLGQDQAWENLREGRPEEAWEELTSLPQTALQGDRSQLGLGAAAYGVSEYASALNAFGKALRSPRPAIQETAHYNLGNTLYQLGQRTLAPAQDGTPPRPGQLRDTIRDWEDAIAHYDQALALDPENEDAQFNRDYVQRKLDQLKQQPEEPSQASQESPEEKESQDDSSEESPSEQPGQDTSSQENQNQETQSGDAPSAPPEEEGASEASPDGTQEEENRTQPSGEESPSQDSATDPGPSGDSSQGQEPRDLQARRNLQEKLAGKSLEEIAEMLERYADEDNRVILPQRMQRFQRPEKNW